jgi:hypothetical protein
VRSMRTFALMTTTELEHPSPDREQALLRLKKRHDPAGPPGRRFDIHSALWAPEWLPSLVQARAAWSTSKEDLSR